MKKSKKIIAILMCVVLTFTAAPLGGLVGLDLPSLFDFRAEAASYSGTCGDNVYWSLDTTTGVLNISGRGEMYNYAVDNMPPWHSFRGDIKTIAIGYGVTSIGSTAFMNYDTITSVSIPDTVSIIYDAAFVYCSGLTHITIPDSVKEIKHQAFWCCDNLETVTMGAGITGIEEGAFGNCDQLTTVRHTGTWSQWSRVDVVDGSGTWIDNLPLINATHIFLASSGIYNLGHETYSFDNFKDSDSKGHCFGMSVTSAGYHLGILDIASIGGNSYDGLYALSETAKVKKPICYYQDIQGSVAKKSIVAGGCHYKNGYFDIRSDWNAVINYVKNFNYNNTGSLQISIRRRNGNGIAGHAINFIRYDIVNGQERIYAYDNNYPDTEVYFYRDSYDGNVKKHVYNNGGEDTAIDCIALRSVSEYFRLAANADRSRYVYAEKDTVYIPGAEEYLIDCNVDSVEMVMFEIPAEMQHAIIVPLTENAVFEYLDKEYSLEQVDEKTDCILTLALDETDSEGANVEFAELNDAFSIESPSTTSVNYGDILVLGSSIGCYVDWECDSGAFSISYDEFGTCYVESVASGTATITATLVDENGEAVLDADGNEISDSITLTSKAGFFQKLISFFKNLFGIDRIVY